jgi:cytohesin
MKKYLSLFLPLFLAGCAPTLPALSKVDQDMFVAVKADNKQEVERLIAAGANVNARTDRRKGYYPRGLTALGWASVWGSNEAAELLIARGADVNASTQRGDTALHAAAYNGQKETVELLVRKGADVNAMDIDRRTPLHEALQYPAIPYLSKSREASPSRIARATDIVDILLARGADVNAKNTAGMMPIHIAASTQKGLVERLVAKGADVNAKGMDDMSPLFLAAAEGRPDVVEWLIAHGAEADARAKNGDTPLLVAAENGCSDEAKILLNHGANIHAKDTNGLTPLLRATQSLKDVHALTSPSPFSKQMLDDMGPVAEMRARAYYPRVKGQWREVAELLINRGAEIINVGDNRPLYVAALVGDKKLVNALLDKGADINYNPKNAYDTPLHGAIGEGHEDVAELLISRGADVNAENKDRQTPLHYLAEYMKSKKLAELMIKHHANVNAKSGRYTPLQLAVEVENKDVAEVLRQHGGE